MSYFNKAWMAVGVAAVHGHSDQAVMLKSGFSSLKAGKRRFFSGGESSPADLRPLTAVVRTEIDGAAANYRDGEERGKQTDESLKNVMYLNCWGQS